ncbi:MAG: hypothetical protein E7614_01510 [Ruminococcaceae bacterium]|nr:hypothetical protein [Oscillospiraceae bacterium]
MRTEKLKKVKKILIAVLILLAVLLVVFIVLKLFSPKVSFTEKRDDIFYFPVDYNENAYDDIVYMSKNREVKFDYYGTSVYINEDNLKEQSPEAKFFYDYIQTVIKGDAEKHKSFFLKSFFANHSIPNKFTMQKIYDVEISAMTSDVKDGFSYETYKVSYKIQENNGTFRADVSSNEAKPVAITVQKGRELKISSIIPIL